ncbi:HK97 gp10 family phage protein [Oenococcus alcoholitolerans]|uniref:HK97 gp10 family phage protein n=1 Tax=Oenococcus alcoholitolerans TaxID=931074 RepID=UPI003F7107AF
MKVRLMDASLGLDDIFENLQKAYDLSPEEQSKITLAGAKVLQKRLAEYIRQHHYRQRKLGKEPHLAETIIVDNHNPDGELDGSSAVGWPAAPAREGGLGYIARFLSDGTKYIKGDDFLDRVRNSCDDEITRAENDEYQTILQEKGYEGS